MKKIFFEKTEQLEDVFKNSDKYLILSSSEFDLKSIEEFNPDLIVFTEKAFNSDPLKVCKTLREKYSILIPIVLLLNFYSPLDISELKALGVKVLIKPFSANELFQVIDEALRKPEVVLKTEDTRPQAEDLREIIRQEVKSEIKGMLKQLLEGMERYA